MKKLHLALLAGCAIGFASCGGMSTVESYTTQEDKAQASATIKLANEEFTSLLQSKFGSLEVDYDDEETWGPEAELMLAAWNSIYTGDISDFVKKAKDYGVYDDFKKIVAKYDVKENSRVLRSYTVDSSSRSISSTKFVDGSMRSGDILLCAGVGENSTSISYVADTVIPGDWKHAGLYDAQAIDDEYVVFTASNVTDAFLNGGTSSSESSSSSSSSSSGIEGAVGYENIAKWTSLPYVKVIRVKGSTAAKGQSAVNYVKNFTGCEYSLFVTRPTNEKWYCSKVCYRAWLNEGIDIEYNKWYYPRGYWVTPTDLDDDEDTYYLFGDKTSD